MLADPELLIGTRHRFSILNYEWKLGVTRYKVTYYCNITIVGNEVVQWTTLNIAII